MPVAVKSLFRKAVCRAVFGVCLSLAAPAFAQTGDDDQDARPHKVNTLTPVPFVQMYMFGMPPLPCVDDTQGTLAITKTGMVCMCIGTNWVFAQTTTACVWDNKK